MSGSHKFPILFLTVVGVFCFFFLIKLFSGFCFWMLSKAFKEFLFLLGFYNSHLQEESCDYSILRLLLLLGFDSEKNVTCSGWGDMSVYFRHLAELSLFFDLWSHFISFSLLCKL